jgi:hypothetical protein
MERINFTTAVLGKKAASRLKEHRVTQTIRSGASQIVLAVNDGRVRPADIIQVALADELIGHARFVGMVKLYWRDLTLEDAHRGGFDNRFEMAYALKRAGYRFKPLDEYPFYRCQFTWADRQGDEP